VLERISKKSFLADVRVLPGMITQYGSAVAPTGYLLCNGGEHLRTSYLDLFAVIGTTYGSSGIDTFRVPNLTSTAVGGFTIYHIIKT
jgi:microcystin-dependent protein